MGNKSKSTPTGTLPTMGEDVTGTRFSAENSQISDEEYNNALNRADTIIENASYNNWGGSGEDIAMGIAEAQDAIREMSREELAELLENGGIEDLADEYISQYAFPAFLLE